ncbi:hypothetical protein AABB24_022392, partial [Solanum stoloniferum]
MQIQAGNNTNNTAHKYLNGGAVNFASILACYSSISDIGNLSCKCLKLNVDSWIIDSGATHHMIFTKSLLNNLRPISYPFLITLPNAYKVKVTKICNVCLNPSLTLYNVLFVPSFKFNLISVHYLASHIKGMVSFKNSSCLMQSPSLKSPLKIGRAQNDLYYLCSGCHTSSSINVPTGSVSTAASGSVSTVVSSSSKPCFLTSSVTSFSKCNPCNLSHATSTINSCNATSVKSTCLSNNIMLLSCV